MTDPGAPPLNLKELEAQHTPPNGKGTVAALVVELREARNGLARAHDAFVTFERKALQSPTDSITVTGALLKVLRQQAAQVLGRVDD